MALHLSKHRLSDLAARFELELRGDGATLIDGVGTLRGATPSQASFLANPGYRKDLGTTRAGVVILKPEDAKACPTNSLLSPNPYLAYARLAALFDARPAQAAGVHSTAVIDPTSTIGSGVSIGPNAVVCAGASIGDGCSIGPGTVIGAESRVGSACQLHANVTLGPCVQLGKRVIVHPGAVLGADGFGLAFAGDHWEKVPQLGTVVIGDDCEIGANTTIDRGALEDTVLEEDVRLDNLVQVGHNVRIGAHTAMAAMAGIAGSTRIGRFCMLGGGCAVGGHLEIADRVTIAARSTVYYSIEEPGTTWSALIPAQPLTAWQRNLSRLRKLDELARRLLASHRTNRGDPGEQDQ